MTNIYDLEIFINTNKLIIILKRKKEVHIEFNFEMMWTRYVIQYCCIYS